MNRLYSTSLRALHFMTQPFSGLVLHNSRRVRVLILAEEKILLQRSSFGKQRWSLPGGGIETKESDIEAAVRETHEETSIVLNDKHLIRLGEARLPKEVKWPQVNMVFFKTTLGKTVKPRVTRPLEILDVQWFPLSELPEDHSDTIDTALAFSNAQDEAGSK